MEELVLEKEQRRERLKWVFHGVGALLIIVCGFSFAGGVEQRVLHTIGRLFRATERTPKDAFVGDATAARSNRDHQTRSLIFLNRGAD